MRKDVVLQSLRAEILMDCKKIIATSTEFFSWNIMEILMFLHKLFIQMNPFEGIFSDKQLIIAESSNFQFAEILNTQEMQPRKFLNFSHVCQQFGKIFQTIELSTVGHDLSNYKAMNNLAWSVKQNSYQQFGMFCQTFKLSTVGHFLNKIKSYNKLALSVKL